MIKNVLLAAALLLTTPVIANELKPTLAEFKGMCFRMNGKLEFTEGRWSCTPKQPLEKGLFPITIYYSE